MQLFDFGFAELSLKGVSFLVFSVLAIAALGYLLGRITIKGVNLGTAGVFLVALLYGALFYSVLEGQFDVKVAGLSVGNYTGNMLKIVENIGLILFVTSVGFIAGPKFFSDLKRNFKTYILLGIVIIFSGALVCVVCTAIATGTMVTPELSREAIVSIMVGLFSGALTSTPAFSASKEAVGEALSAQVSVGNGIAYIFGVVGVVLFVQLVPKFLKVDMAAERAKLEEANKASSTKKAETEEKKLLEIDGFGIAPFALAAIIGMILGSVKFGAFSLTTTGGCLLTALVFGHFGKIGRIKIMPSITTLKVFREFGLMMFLIGAGVAGGAQFVKYFHPIYFLYGAIMTVMPMIMGFVFAKYILKLNILNALGSITGGMTSTPALGTLINVAGTEDVAAAYASTYPISLISVVLCSQFIIMFFL